MYRLVGHHDLGGLGILPRVELQRQKGWPGFALPALLADVAAHSDFAARITVLLDLFVDVVRL